MYCSQSDQHALINIPISSEFVKKIPLHITVISCRIYNKSTDSQKECCAVIAMREAVETLAARENISYEEALLRFTSSRAYEALFDFDTEIWKEGSDYLLSLYDYCTSKKTA